MPFYYRQNDDGTFKFEIAGRKEGWSMAALKWLNYMSYDARFRKNDREQYTMQCCLTGEKEVKVGKHRYTVDGYVETSSRIYFLEFFGCRKIL